MNEEYSIEEKLEEVMCENKLLKKEIKDLCKKIKVNEKSRRKMQQSLMKQIQQRDNIINKAKEFVYDYKKQWTLNDDVLDDMNELLKILNIDKGDE